MSEQLLTEAAPAEACPPLRWDGEVRVPWEQSSSEPATGLCSDGPSVPPSMLRIRTAIAPDPATAPPELSKRTVVREVLRRGGPKLLEASVVPALLFYICLVWGELGLAYISAIVWTYGCVLRHLVRRRAVPTVLILGAIGVSIRTAIAVGSGSQFVYFAQPILGTVVTGGVFLASVVTGRPLIGRLAHDFWPITPEMHANPRVLSLFRGLTILWAGVNLATASVTFALLLWLPMPTFVALKQVTGTGITVSAIAVTIIWSHRIACSEGIVSAPKRRAALAAAPA